MKSIAQIAREEDARAVRRMFAHFRRPAFAWWLGTRAALLATYTAIAWVSWRILSVFGVV